MGRNPAALRFSALLERIQSERSSDFGHACDDCPGASSWTHVTRVLGTKTGYLLESVLRPSLPLGAPPTATSPMGTLDAGTANGKDPKDVLAHKNPALRQGGLTKNLSTGGSRKLGLALLVEFVFSRIIGPADDTVWCSMLLSGDDDHLVNDKL